MAKFLFVFRGGGGAMSGLSAAERGANLQKWRAWITGLTLDNHTEPGGHPVQTTGRTLQGRAMKLSEAPFNQGQGMVTGTLVVLAADLDEATQLARGCPAFDFDGSVEIRPVIERPA